MTEWDRIARAAGVEEGPASWRDRLEALERALEGGAARRGLPEASRRVGSSGQCRRLARFVAGLVERWRRAPGPWSGWARWSEELLADCLGGPVARAGWPAEEEQAWSAVHEALGRLGVLDRIGPASAVSGGGPPVVGPPWRAMVGPSVVGPSVVGPSVVGAAVFRAALAAELGAVAPPTTRFGRGLFAGRMAELVGLSLDVVFVVGMHDGAFPARAPEDPLLPDRERAAAKELPLRVARAADEHRDYLAALAAAQERVLSFARADQGDGREQRPSRWLLDALGGVGRRPGPAGPARPAASTPGTSRTWGSSRGTASCPRTRRRSGLRASRRRWPTATFAASSSFPRRPGALDGHPLACRRTGPGPRAAGSARRGAAADSPASTDGSRAPRCCRRYRTRPSRPRGWSTMPPARVATSSTRCSASPSLRRAVGDVGLTAGRSRVTWSTGCSSNSWPSSCPADGVGQHPPGPGVGRGRAGAHDPGGELGLRRVGTGRADGSVRSLGARARDDRGRPRRLLGRRRPLAGRARGRSPGGRARLRAARRPAVAVDLPDGRQVRFRGTVDRIDLTAAGDAAIVVDYKTGSRHALAPLADDPVARGTKLQLPVYGLAARAHLGVGRVHASYRFVGGAGDREPVGYDVGDDVLDRLGGALGVLVDRYRVRAVPRPPRGGVLARLRELSHLSVHSALPARPEPRLGADAGRPGVDRVRLAGRAGCGGAVTALGAGPRGAPARPDRRRPGRRVGHPPRSVHHLRGGGGCRHGQDHRPRGSDPRTGGLGTGSHRSGGRHHLHRGGGGELRDRIGDALERMAGGAPLALAVAGDRPRSGPARRRSGRSDGPAPPRRSGRSTPPPSGPCTVSPAVSSPSTPSRPACPRWSRSSTRPAPRWRSVSGGGPSSPELLGDPAMKPALTASLLCGVDLRHWCEVARALNRDWDLVAAHPMLARPDPPP